MDYIQSIFKDVEVIVAPFEADPQLAYLTKIDYVDGVITEDSDLLVFGAKVGIYKLFKDQSMYYDEFRLENIFKRKVRIRDC